MDDIHSCSYYCQRPACVLAQRDELRDGHGAGNQAPPPAQPAAQPVQRLSDEQRRELIDVLRGGRQCDEDGTEIIMSRQACCEAADIIEAALQPQGWQPIETAPKDGQEFVTANSMQGFVKELVSWNRIHGYWQSKGKSIHMQATHWMPLPARPGGAS